MFLGLDLLVELFYLPKLLAPKPRFLKDSDNDRNYNYKGSEACDDYF